MRARLPVFGLAGIACWSAAMLLAGERLRLTDGDLAPSRDGVAAEAIAMGPAVQPVVIEQKLVRKVSPEQFAAPFAADGSLERVAPREPLGSDDVKPVQPVRLARPQTIAGGLMIFGTRTLRLAGIIVTDRMRTCPTADGRTWPCGAMARTHQRLLLRNRTVDCDLPSPTWRGEKVASCQVGGIDMATWLVENGWAEAEPGSPLEPLATEARAARRGIFGDDPRADATSTRP